MISAVQVRARQQYCCLYRAWREWKAFRELYHSSRTFAQASKMAAAAEPVLLPDQSCLWIFFFLTINSRRNCAKLGKLQLPLPCPSIPELDTTLICTFFWDKNYKAGKKHSKKLTALDLARKGPKQLLSSPFCTPVILGVQNWQEKYIQLLSEDWILGQVLSKWLPSSSPRNLN